MLRVRSVSPSRSATKIARRSNVGLNDHDFILNSQPIDLKVADHVLLACDFRSIKKTEFKLANMNPHISLDYLSVNFYNCRGEGYLFEVIGIHACQVYIHLRFDIYFFVFVYILYSLLHRNHQRMDANDEGVIFDFKIRGANVDHCDGCYLVNKLPTIFDNIAYTMTYVDKHKFNKGTKLECLPIPPKALFQSILYDRMWCCDQQFVKPPSMWMPNNVSVRMSPTVDMSRNIFKVEDLNFSDVFVNIKEEKKRIKDEKPKLRNSLLTQFLDKGSYVPGQRTDVVDGIQYMFDGANFNVCDEIKKEKSDSLSSVRASVTSSSVSSSPPPVPHRFRYSSSNGVSLPSVDVDLISVE